MRVLLSLALLGASAHADDAVHDLPSLVAAMESLQSPIKDFRCEFEGQEIYKGDKAEATSWERGPDSLGPDGLAKIFGGVFVWQRDGDRRCDFFERWAVGDHVRRDITLVHPRDGKMERSHLSNVVRSLENVSRGPLEPSQANTVAYYGELLPLDSFRNLRNRLEEDAVEATVTDDAIDGRPLKLVTVWLKIKTVPKKLLRRYWIDMARSGQAVRIDRYYNDSLGSQCDIELKPFRVGEAEVWMPVAAEDRNHFAGNLAVAKAPTAERIPTALRSIVFAKEPTSLRSIRVIEGTMEFNKKPAGAMFSLDHKPAAPKSEPVRDLFQRFNQKVPAHRPTQAEAETMLREQIAKADQEGRLLVAFPREGINWWPWSVAGLGLVLTTSLTVLWMRRGPR